MIKKEIRDRIVTILKRDHAGLIARSGSYAPGEACKKSDIDILSVCLRKALSSWLRSRMKSQKPSGTGRSVTENWSARTFPPQFTGTKW